MNRLEQFPRGPLPFKDRAIYGTCKPAVTVRLTIHKPPFVAIPRPCIAFFSKAVQLAILPLSLIPPGYNHRIGL